MYWIQLAKFSFFHKYHLWNDRFGCGSVLGSETYELTYTLTVNGLYQSHIWVFMSLLLLSEIMLRHITSISHTFVMSCLEIYRQMSEAIN